MSESTNEPTIEFKPLNIKCPYCGGQLSVRTEYQGSPYMQDREVTGIECYECEAEWDAEFNSTEAPNWIQWPGLYSKPEHLKNQDSEVENDSE